jgi:hypothetical protein
VKGGWRPTRAAAAALALAACGTLATPALAEQDKFHVRPTLKLKRTVGQDTFSGKLRSKEHACEANRKVKLHHRNVTQQAKSGVIAKVKTNGKGKWKFVPKKNDDGFRYATPGNYTVKVGQKRVSTGHGEAVCRSKNSSSLLVG